MSDKITDLELQKKTKDDLLDEYIANDIDIESIPIDMRDIYRESMRDSLGFAQYELSHAVNKLGNLILKGLKIGK